MKYLFLNKKLKLILLFSSVLILFSACGNYKNTTTTKNTIEHSPEIIFLYYSIEQALSGKRNIQFINKKIVDGKLKSKQYEPIKNGKEGDLILLELDENLKELLKIRIKNPLIKTIEFIDESKNFKTKVIKLDKTRFTVRLQLQNSTKYITISNFAENKPLIKTQIN